MEGNPSAGNMAPQAQIQTAQNTAQGDAATPLETGLRQRGDAENQRAAEAKAAPKAALASFNRERRQKTLRNAQELIECLGSGMDLLSPEQGEQRAPGSSEKLRREVERPQERESSRQRGRPQGGGQGCRAGNDRQIKRAAAKSGHSASGG